MSKPLYFQFGVYAPDSGTGVPEYLYLHSELLKQDLNYNFVVFDTSQPQDYYKAESVNGIVIHHFGKLRRLFMLYPLFPKKFLHWLRETSRNADMLFHLHSVFRLSNYVLSKHLVQNSIPFIFTPHDSYSKESLEKRYWLKLFFLKTFEKYILNNAQVVHAITRQGIDSIGKFTNNTTEFVSNFVLDKTKLYPNAPLKPQICFIGRFDIYQKGIDLQLQAFKIFLSQSEKTAPFILVGGFSEKEKSDFDIIVDQLEIRDMIKSPGFVTVDEKYKVLSESYVYLQLSRFEGFGLSIVEALSFGKPVIITPQVPISNFVLQHKAGRVVKDEKEAAKALIDIFKLSDVQYDKLSKNARSCYVANFHPDSIKPRLLQMINKSRSKVNDFE